MSVLAGERIWLGDPEEKDTYVDFKGTFSFDGEQKVILRLSCDTIFEFFINGRSAGFGNCSNFPGRPVYYTFDLTRFCKDKNEIRITVWHQGVSSSTVIPAEAFLLFEISSGDRSLLKSGPDILCRVNPFYRSGHLKWITGQMGLSYFYDATGDANSRWEKAQCTGEGTAWENGILPLRLLPAVSGEIRKTSDGVLVDLGREYVGFLELDIESDREQTVRIEYGEHLRDGRVPGRIHSRDFSVEIRLKKGRTRFRNRFRRFGCRYLEFTGESCKVYKLGIRPVRYPVTRIPRRFPDDRLQQIYDVGVYTLECCMHEHYEDCPWREQALYTMDSRNQMLCGYTAFRGHAFQRENLRMISRGLRPDGQLNICFPAGTNLEIPFFSLVYVLQVWEYVRVTGDREILTDLLPVLKTILDTFTGQISAQTGLIPSFPFPCWNFYEWNEVNSNHSDLQRGPESDNPLRFDLNLNAMYVYVCGLYDRLSGSCTDTSDVRKGIRKMFYDKDTGLYRVSSDCSGFSILGNALAVLAGIGDRKTLETALERTDLVVPITLSMRTFLYEAIRKTDRKNAGQRILADIRRVYGRMLDAGATTFWETELGAEDFGGAGSLCHGWSALPVYYLVKYMRPSGRKPM
ncbi:MAG: family 78 glycoside hydrolase catalytic domain [Clostridia bacterium]|nr:family 78 glycoside hydrolase catalytic domain [Clostridia bacterium]